MTHFVLMTIYALLVSLFFAALWRTEPTGRVRLFVQIFASMMGGALLLGWLMYPFPSGPPALFP